MKARLVSIFLILVSGLLTYAQEGNPVFNTAIVETAIVEPVEIEPQQPDRSYSWVVGCSGADTYRSDSWTYVMVEGRTLLCEVATLTVLDILPDGYLWPTYYASLNSPADPETAVVASPDGRYLILEANDDERIWHYWSYDTATGALITLGTIPEDRDAIVGPLPRHPLWLTDSIAVFSYGPAQESLDKGLFRFDATKADSMELLTTGWFYNSFENPRRIEKLTSEQWLSFNGKVYARPYPCTFEIVDANGYRKYILGDTCPVEYSTMFSEVDWGGTSEFRSEDGRNLIFLRTVDQERGIAQIVQQDVQQLDGLQTVWYEGEIEYLLSNTNGTAVAILDDDGSLNQSYPYFRVDGGPATTMLIVRESGWTLTIPLRVHPELLPNQIDRIISEREFLAVTIIELAADLNTRVQVLRIIKWSTEEVTERNLTGITSGRLISVSPQADWFIFSDGVLYNPETERTGLLITEGTLESTHFEWVDDQTSIARTEGLDRQAWRIRADPQLITRKSDDLPQIPNIIEFGIVDLETGEVIASLFEGMQVDPVALNATGDLAILAYLNVEAVGSVVFELNGMIVVDNDLFYGIPLPPPGSYMLTGTPYNEPDGRDIPGTPFTVNFTVVREAPTREAPTAEASPTTEASPTAAANETPTPVAIPEGMCQLEVLIGASLRSGPGVDQERIGSAAVGFLLRADGYAFNPVEYMRWWRLDTGEWVREDLVAEAPDCEALPEIKTEGS